MAGVEVWVMRSKGWGGHGFRAYIVHCTHFLFILSEGTIGEFLAETSDRT